MNRSAGEEIPTKSNKEKMLEWPAKLGGIFLIAQTKTYSESRFLLLVPD